MNRVELGPRLSEQALRPRCSCFCMCIDLGNRGARRLPGAYSPYPVVGVLGDGGLRRRLRLFQQRSMKFFLSAA